MEANTSVKYDNTDHAVSDQVTRHSRDKRAATPEERAARFSAQATARTRRAIKGIRHIGDLVTGHAVFKPDQVEAIYRALRKEARVVHGAMLARLARGTAARDIDFHV